MFVSNSMVKHVITIDEAMLVFKAKELMLASQIRHLPVVDKENRVIGIVTDRDIRSAMPDSLLKVSNTEECRTDISQKKVGEIMTRNPITISPMDTIQDVLLIIKKEKVGALPVVDAEGKLKGIISVQDLLSAFIDVMGLEDPGTLIGILVEDKIGQMKQVVDIITKQKISFGSIMVVKTWEKNKRAIFPYLLTNNLIEVKRKLKKAGFPLIDPMEWYLSNLHDREPSPT
ncbi:MAG: CBS domain-containing protein [Pseudomonadota bacterium]